MLYDPEKPPVANVWKAPSRTCFTASSARPHTARVRTRRRVGTESPYDRSARPPERKRPNLDPYSKEIFALTAEAWRRNTEPIPGIENPFAELDDDALIELLFTEEDRLRRSTRSLNGTTA